MFTELLPNGRYRGGFRAGGRKFTKAFDYQWEAEEWATAAEKRARRAAELADADASPATSWTPPAAAPVVPAAPTVAAYGDVWITARRSKWVDSTLTGYRIQLDAIKADEIGDLTLDAITIGDVEEWQARQVDNGVGVATINARLKVLRMLSRYAVKNRVPGVYDATDGVAFLTAVVRKGRPISKIEENALLLAAHSEEATAQLLLGVDAGLRFEEALGLPVDCLVGGDQFLDVRQVVERSRKIRGFTKGKKPRVVPTTDRVVAALRPLIAKAETEGRELVFSKIDDDGVERPVDYHNWRRDVWYRVTGKAGVNRRSDAKVNPGRLHFHDLRHTYGTRLAAAGVPRSEIAEVMGHADEDTTKIYIHAGTDGRRRRLVLAALNGVEAEETADAAEAVRGDLKAV